MNKKVISISLLVVSVFVLMLVLSACSMLGIGTKTGTTEQITISQPSVNSYDTVTDSNVAELVASVGLTNTYELTAHISYTCVVTNGFGMSQTISNTSSSQATAFAINESGYLITNAHAITVDLSKTYQSYRDLKYTSRKLYVNLADNDNRMIPCDIIAYNETLDLAILKMQFSGTLENGTPYTIDEVPYAVFFDHQDPSDSQSTTTLKYGETAIAVGNANGYGISITTGVVSAPLRLFEESAGVVTKAIQTDTAINPGNSGGPLFNAYCAVIGVNTFKIVEENTENLGYAVPTYVVLEFIDSIVNGTYDKQLTLGADGNAYSGKENIVYYTTTQRQYSSTGENVVAHNK